MVDARAVSRGGGRPGLYGRAAELEVVRRPAPSGSSAVVLAGEAGIGKSTLWREGCATVRSSGATVLAATASEAEAGMAWVSLSDLLDRTDERVFEALPAPQREALDGALLRRHVDQVPAPRTIAAGLLGVLRQLAQRGPVTVAIDDLHWADEETQRALAFAVRRLADAPIHLLLTVRTADLATPRSAYPDPVLLGALPRVRRVALEPLAPEAVGALLNERCGRQVGVVEVAAITTATRGNPFWALEFGLAGRPDGRGIPDSLRSLVTDRLGTVDPAVVDVLRTVAALGRPSMGELVRALRHLGGDRERLVDAAVAAGLVEESGGRASAAHPLLGAGAIESAPPCRRVALHRAIAATTTSPEIRANHLHGAHTLATEGVPATAEVVRALDEAARAAESRGAPAAAADFAERARALTGPRDPSDARRRLAAAGGYGRAADFESVLRVLHDFDPLHAPIPETEEALPWLARARHHVHGEASVRELLDRLRASAALGAEPRREALLLTLASDPWLGSRGDLTMTAERALRLAEWAGSSDVVLHRALGNVLEARLNQGHGLDEELLDRRRELERAGLPESINGSADVQRGRGLGSTDRLSEATAELRRCTARATEVGDAFAASYCGVQLAYRELCAGHLDAARSAVDAATAALEWHQPEPVDLLSVRGLVLLAQDLPDEVEEAIARHQDNPDRRRRRRTRVLKHLPGMLAWQRGDLDTAVELLTRFETETAAHGVIDPGRRLHVDGDLAELLARLGRTEQAEQIAARLWDLGERGGRPSLLAQSLRVRARLADRSDDPVAALAHARDAVGRMESNERRPELGRCLLLLGELRRRHDDIADPVELRRAQALFGDIGFRWWLGQVEAARSAPPSEATPTSAPRRTWAALTEGERRVAELVSRGATNRDVATALHLSVRTVEGHLSSAYRKVGVRTRTELAVHSTT